MAETINMPKLGFDMAEGVLVRWVRKEGENIKKGDVLVEIETDKATVEVESPASGVVLRHIVDEGTVVPVGAPIAVVGQPGEKVSEQLPVTSDQSKVESPRSVDEKPLPTPPIPAPASQASAPTDGAPVKASPLAKKIARDNQLDLSRIQGTGPGGRVVKKDVEAALASVQAIAISHQPALTFVATSHEEKTIPLTKLRQAIARRMTESKTSVPHFYVTREYKMDALMALRKQINEFLPDNEKLSVNDFIVKAVALTLREFPNLNASFAGDKVIRRSAVNIGIAVAVENGLLTIAHKDTDQKPLRQISNEVKAMVGRAREGKVKPEDIEGSTFSISNLGMYEVENFIAIVNPPEAAILAIGSAREVPVVEHGEIKVGWRMKATISVDHRVSDGAEAAQFMQKLAEFLENPLRMLV